MVNGDPNFEAYLLALGHLDDFIKIIRDSKNRDEARERLIVPVTLQTLLENALKHNIVNAKKPLQITISSTLQGGVWYLMVENTLQRRTLVENSNKQGLARLAALYEHISDDAPPRVMQD